jgi:hypothetical protein
MFKDFLLYLVELFITVKLYTYKTYVWTRNIALQCTLKMYLFAYNRKFYLPIPMCYIHDNDIFENESHLVTIHDVWLDNNCQLCECNVDKIKLTMLMQFYFYFMYPYNKKSKNLLDFICSNVMFHCKNPLYLENSDFDINIHLHLLISFNYPHNRSICKDRAQNTTHSDCIINNKFLDFKMLSIDLTDKKYIINTHKKSILYDVIKIKPENCH